MREEDPAVDHRDVHIWAELHVLLGGVEKEGKQERRKLEGKRGHSLNKSQA